MAGCFGSRKARGVRRRKNAGFRLGKKTGFLLKNPAEMTLQGFTDRLLFLCPVREGWAVVGVEEKYLSPATVRIVSRTAEKLVLDVLGIRNIESLGGRRTGRQDADDRRGMREIRG